MRKITEVLRLKFEAKLSHEKIACAVGVSKGAVNKYVSLAKAQGLSWPLPPDMDDAALETRLYPPREASTRYAEPDHAKLHSELKRKGVTLQLLWSEYVAEVGERAYRYSQFCERYRQWAKRQKRSMRQVHRAGEKLFIDYCGPTVPVVDPQTGEFRSAQVFVAVLGASSYSYTYAEATWSRSLPDWIASHQRAFAFFDGVPQLLVPDNLRSGVSKACRYAPEPNATYLELARHYRTAILPARPYKPKDKAKPGIDYHIEADKRFYSVPHILVGEVLDVRPGASTVEVLHKRKRVALHPRRGPDRFSTLDEHMPETHRAHRQWSPRRFMNWAKDIGPATLAVIKHQLHNRPHPEHGYRSCLGLLNHARGYGRGAWKPPASGPWRSISRPIKASPPSSSRVSINNPWNRMPRGNR